MSVVCKCLFQGQFHQFLGRRAHIFVTLTELNHCKSKPLQILRHLYRTPAVKCYLFDVKLLSQFIDEVFDKAIVNHIPLSCFQIALPFPYIIRNVVTPYSEGQRFFRQPEVRQNVVMLIVFSGWKDKHKSCNIRCAGKVESTVADSSFQFRFIKGNLAFIPFLHRHPTHCLFYPLIQTQLSKSIFFAGSLLCRITRRHHLIHADCLVEGWICFFPNLRIRPVFRFICTVNDRIESRIVLSAFQNVFRLLVYLIADAVGVCSGCGDEKIQRLHSGITGAFGHNIKQLSVRLRMQFIKHNPVNVETVLGVGFCRKHLIEAVGRDVHDTLL